MRSQTPRSLQCAHFAIVKFKIFSLNYLLPVGEAEKKGIEPKSRLHTASKVVFGGASVLKHHGTHSQEVQTDMGLLTSEKPRQNPCPQLSSIANFPVS